MATNQETLLDWLRNAHAMEEQAEQMLSSTAQRLRDYPELQATLDEHVLQTRGQALRLRRCIERRGSNPSVLKDIAGKMIAFGQGLSGMFLSDEPVKAALAVATFARMEIASYRILIAAARQVGDAETALVCEQNLREEEAMADRIDGMLETVTQRFLARAGQSETAPT